MVLRTVATVSVNAWDRVSLVDHDVDTSRVHAIEQQHNLLKPHNFEDAYVIALYAHRYGITSQAGSHAQPPLTS